MRLENLEGVTKLADRLKRCDADIDYCRDGELRLTVKSWIVPAEVMDAMRPSLMASLEQRRQRLIAELRALGVVAS